MNRQIAVQTRQQKPGATPFVSGLPQRQRACGDYATGGACETCRRKPEAETGHAISRLSYDFSAIPCRVSRQTGGGAKGGSAPKSCAGAELKKTNRFAEAARIENLRWVGIAQAALTRLQSAWINNKSQIISGQSSVSGETVCAFNSNFNTRPTDPDYGVTMIRVERQLKALRSRLAKPVAYSCQSSSDPECTGKNRDTVAYVRGGAPPIHFCPQFRDDVDALNRQTTVLHEFAHLIPGVRDEGGYASGGVGAQVTTCSTGVKFSADPEVLTRTADALAGFVMHVGQKHEEQQQAAAGTQP